MGMKPDFWQVVGVLEILAFSKFEAGLEDAVDAIDISLPELLMDNSLDDGESESDGEPADNSRSDAVPEVP